MYAEEESGESDVEPPVSDHTFAWSSAVMDYVETLPSSTQRADMHVRLNGYSNFHGNVYAPAGAERKVPLVQNRHRDPAQRQAC